MQAMNNQGITVSMNYSLVDQADNSLDGMAMVFLMRQIVQYASTLDEAMEIVLEYTTYLWYEYRDFRQQDP